MWRFPMTRPEPGSRYRNLLRIKRLSMPSLKLVHSEGMSLNENKALDLHINSKDGP